MISMRDQFYSTFGLRAEKAFHFRKLALALLLCLHGMPQGIEDRAGAAVVGTRVVTCPVPNRIEDIEMRVRALCKFLEKVCCHIRTSPHRRMRCEFSHIGQVGGVGFITLEEWKELVPKREELTKGRRCCAQSSLKLRRGKMDRCEVIAELS